jgi:hypothetical protein
MFWVGAHEFEAHTPDAKHYIVVVNNPAKTNGDNQIGPKTGLFLVYPMIRPYIIGKPTKSQENGGI